MQGKLRQKKMRGILIYFILELAHFHKHYITWEAKEIILDMHLDLT